MFDCVSAYIYICIRIRVYVCGHTCLPVENVHHPQDVTTAWIPLTLTFSLFLATSPYRSLLLVSLLDGI